ncbi:LysR family transcriptional regulator [Pseudoxanthomonas winnipegensis]|uniref:LysR family transcriptional regulator n=2 Tax=Pseudoxanthomonas winnipegensis TaxID=2480810 RepID=A0A4Q8L4V0_9GAMM|nr:LysR family transcriptional regulator [Pseudoxanthomonas winnipegensis]
MRNQGPLVSGASVLIAVVQAGTLARAAEALGMSPSGVSRALARLEQRIGARLLARTTRTLSLTDEGRRFYERVAPHLAEIEDAALEAGGSADVVRGRLRVNVDPYFSRVLLSRHIAGFMARHPQLSLELIMRDAVGDLVADGFDLAVRFDAPPEGAFVARKLGHTRVLTVAAPSYLAASGRPARPEDIETRECIDFLNPTTGRAYAWEVRRGDEVLPLKVKGRLMTSDSGTLLGACLSGFGIAQVLALGCEDLLRDGHLVNLFPDWCDERFPLYAISPTRQHRPAKVRAFIAFIAEIVEPAFAEPPRTRAPRRGRAR